MVVLLHSGVARRVGRIWIGCSGWQYPSWRGTFYPASLPASRWLANYSRRFETVEVNNTFYRLPELATFAAWRDATPRGFLMAVKASRYLTHLKRLREPGPPLTRLFSRAFALGPRLGPILFQLPATLRHDEARLEHFLRALSARAARSCASNARAAPSRRVRRPRFVIEFRDVSWYRPDVFEVLRRARVAACLHDMPGSAIADAPGSPFLYVRFHGTTGKYRGSYDERTLEAWGRRLRAASARGRDAYAYFNNDLDGAAVANARSLMRHAGLDVATE